MGRLTQRMRDMSRRFSACPTATLALITRNFDYEHGLCNGTRCLMVRPSTRFLEVLILSGPRRRGRAFIPRIPLTLTDVALPARLLCRQFPVRLVGAMTISKAQGPDPCPRLVVTLRLRSVSPTPRVRARTALRGDDVASHLCGPLARSH